MNDHRSGTYGTSEQYPNINGYEVIRLLGKGGFGEVYLCKRDIVDATSTMYNTVGATSTMYFAVKRVIGSIGIQEFDLFIDEIRNLYMVSLMPYTVRYIDSFTESHGKIFRFFDIIKEGYDYWRSSIFESLSNETLDDRNTNNYIVTSYAPGVNIEKCYLPKDDVNRILRELIYAVLQYHECGIIHRDLKGDNILYDESNQTFTIIDFGIVKLPDHNLRDPRAGTHEYMPPEEREERATLHSNSTLFVLDPGTYDYKKRDSYSLGVVFYKIMNKRSPFEGDVNLYEPKLNPIPSDTGNILLDTMIDKLITPIPENRIYLWEALNYLQ